MTDLTSFFYVDNVDKVKAAHVNNLLAATLRAEYRNAETLSATRALIDADTPIQTFTPSGADRAVTFPAAAITNHVFLIINASATYSLLMPTGIADIAPGQSRLYASNGVSYYEPGAGRDTTPSAYQLAVTVATDNLTVALKNQYGNDPTAAAPVRVQIGNTLREVTAALSVTAAAATNWFAAGSAEMAAKEIDYFVYLGYNATDGVTLGFSRIPFARIYSDFSATTTNGTYCRISTITTAAASDPYTVIGRFAATLSAGAGYTWTVPTFTAANLIHAPVYRTRVLTWLPTYTADGLMTFESVTTTEASYFIDTDRLYPNVICSGTTGGTASNLIYISTPLAFVGDQSTMMLARVRDATSGVLPLGIGGCSLATGLFAAKLDNANYGLGAGRTVRIGGAGYPIK